MSDKLQQVLFNFPRKVYIVSLVFFFFLVGFINWIIKLYEIRFPQ
jgi:hypothetical protein